MFSDIHKAVVTLKNKAKSDNVKSIAEKAFHHLENGSTKHYGFIYVVTGAALIDIQQAVETLQQKARCLTVLFIADTAAQQLKRVKETGGRK